MKIYDVTDWTTNNYNTYIGQISTSKGNQTMKLDQLIEYNRRNILYEKSYTKCGKKASSGPFIKYEIELISRSTF